MSEVQEKLLQSSVPGEEAPKPSWYALWRARAGLPRRYVIAILAFLGFCNIYCLRVNLSVAIVSMAEEFGWDSKSRGLILSAFFYGYILTQIPGGWLAGRYGGKRVLGYGVLITSILTLLTPLAVYGGGAGLLVALRVCQGLAEGVAYPAAHALWSEWAPSSERSRLVTIAFSGSYVGTVISLPVSGLLAERYGWGSIFYVFGILALLWTSLWMWNVAEKPSEDKYISQDEIEFISSEQRWKGGLRESERAIPWRAMLTSGPVWGINAAHFAENWGFYTLLTLLPTYMHDLYNYPLSTSGTISALPYLLMAVVVQLAGILADFLRMNHLSTTNARKLFTCGAFSVQTLFIILAAFVTSPVWAIICLTVAVGLGGFAWAGFSVNHLDIAPSYASVLMGISNTFATLPGIISPALAGSMVTNGTSAEWRGVFTVSGSIYLVGGVAYAILASGEQQPWADSATMMEVSSCVDSD